MLAKKKKKLPIGIEFFASMIEENYYYVDKTLFIRDILDKGSKFTLCTRPRRFGKTLNQTMLKCFFEDTAPLNGKDKRALFNGLKIETAGEEYMEHQGKYPVIFLSLKEAKLKTFEKSYYKLRYEIIEEFKRHRYVFEKIDEDDKLLFQKLVSGNGNEEDYSSSIKFLSKCLEIYHGRKAIILIDEYDVPLENSWQRGFYEDMVDFIRSLMGEALKSNEHLQLAVMTGCLRISKESIFTGLNNLDVISILEDRYDEYFGFTQNEVDAMLKHYNLENKRNIIKDWYDGYLFGRKEVYNPWSVINCLSRVVENPERDPKPYWANTSSNDIVKRLLEKSNTDVRKDLEKLMSGGIISKKIHEDVTYDEIDKKIDNFWNFLFFTGYLKKVGIERQDKDGKLILDLAIPNREVRYIYVTKIQDWFDEKVEVKDFSLFFDALLNGNAQIVQDELNNLLGDCISYFDGKEDFYHGLIVGILGRLQHYTLTSNRETGLGRCDIVLKQATRRNKAVIIELKWAKKEKYLKKECDAALKQIEDNKYSYELISDNYTEIIKYGVAFCGKYCEVKKGTNNFL
ncbi:MAG: ATP-binding protein [Marinilabiliaceae bacterium]|nr:ATP-binding protein [Marinilabiliaceae bacterium]